MSAGILHYLPQKIAFIVLHLFKVEFRFPPLSDIILNALQREKFNDIWCSKKTYSCVYILLCNDLQTQS